MSVSIIIPTFNEALVLPAALDNLGALQPQPLEVIVVDGGSTDATVSLVKTAGCKLIVASKGRGAQLHEGAMAAKGTHLIFLHADTLIPTNAVNLVEHALKEDTVLIGFRSIMQGKKRRRFISFHNRIKTYYAPFFYRPYHTLFKGLRLLFGDQVMCCKRLDYIRSGGFDPKRKIMEEADLCVKMNRLGVIRQLPQKVYSSDRRVAAWGTFKAHLIYISIVIGWVFRISDDILMKWYRDIR